MGSQRSQKRQLELARLEKAKAKRERKQLRSEADETAGAADGPRRPQSEVIAALAELHRRFADDEVSLDEFEEQRDALNDELLID